MRRYGTTLCLLAYHNNMATDKTFDNLDLSKDEVKRLGEALKDEKFRKMLVEYAEEISDPENRRKAEEEIRMMENERGMNVQFIHPKPGHVLKTTVDGTIKAFINICQNDKIEKPSSKKQAGPDGKRGLMWHIPHSFAPPRDDTDKSKGKCKVFDVVFHPDTYRMAINNNRFKKLVEDTALEGVERQFDVTLDKQNFKRPKMTFKGQPTATVIRERNTENGNLKPDADSILGKMPYPYDNKTSSEKSAIREEKNKVNSSESKNSENKKNENDKFTVPKYTITHRSKLDMSEYRNAPDAKTSTRPNELVIKIELPMLKSAAELNLDIFERKIVLESVIPAAYKLDLTLPFPVNDDEGSAKFDKSKRCLTITLPVIPEEVPALPFSHIGDGDVLQNGCENDDSAPTSDLVTVIENKPNKENDEPTLTEAEHNVNKPKKNSETPQVNAVNGQVKLPKDVKWLIPEYQVSQDTETVSFVIKVSNVDDKSIAMSFSENSRVDIKFVSVGAGGFPCYYAMVVEFDEKCKLSPKHSSVDANDDNLVLLILKDKSCRQLWDSFSIGLDKDSMESKQFLTESNLKRDLCALDEEAEKNSDMSNEKDNFNDLSVVEMQTEKLTIEIKPKVSESKGSEKNEDQEHDPLSPLIEVVHRHPTPPLHSILKQRTISESSEDHSLSASTSNLESAGEEQSCPNRRRTVSFNSHIDRASFKSNASVSSMTPALKSKRKRQRRKDEKVKKAERRRQRKHSEGTSSGEEMSRESFSDSHSVSEEESEEMGKAFQRSVSDPGPNVDEFDKEGYVESQHEGDVFEVSTDSSEKKSNDSEVLDFRTKSCDNETSNESVQKESKEKMSVSWNEKVTKEITSKLAAGTDGSDEGKECDSDDDDVGESGKGFSGVKECNESVNVNSVQNIGKESSEENKESESCDKEDKKSEVNTMLSWEDGPRVNGTEHTTECSFQFSNTVMYDLDVD